VIRRRSDPAGPIGGGAWSQRPVAGEESRLDLSHVVVVLMGASDASTFRTDVIG
jgi:hypothetical protein